MSDGDGGERGLPPLPSGASREELKKAARELVVKPEASTLLPDPYDHGRMTEAEAIGVISGIAIFYPGWMSGLPQEVVANTIHAWAAELAPLGEEKEVWPLVLDILRIKKSEWPPTIFEIRSFVSGRLYAKRTRIRVQPEKERTPEETKRSELIRADHLMLIRETIDEGAARFRARERAGWKTE